MRTGVDESLGFAEMLENQALLFASLDRRSEAIQALIQALKLQVVILGENDPIPQRTKKAMEFFQSEGFKPSMALNRPPLAVLQHDIDISQFCPVD
jgi:hypothetical protein